MNWTESIMKAINYIEENLTNDITMNDITKETYISPYYFQKCFKVICGYTINEYIKNRRLTLAGQELINTNNKIIDLALKYGYDSPDSFTKAFTRFHGCTPTKVRNGAKIKEFVPLKVNITLKGGCTMEYKIVEKESFKVIGLKREVKYEDANTEIPKIWQAFFEKNTNSQIKPKYALNFDNDINDNTFEYMICDDYEKNTQIPQTLKY